MCPMITRELCSGPWCVGLASIPGRRKASVTAVAAPSAAYSLRRHLRVTRLRQISNPLGWSQQPPADSKAPLANPCLTACSTQNTLLLCALLELGGCPTASLVYCSRSRDCLWLSICVSSPYLEPHAPVDQIKKHSSLCCVSEALSRPVGCEQAQGSKRLRHQVKWADAQHGLTTNSPRCANALYISSCTQR